jgi:hypothetical protein
MMPLNLIQKKSLLGALCVAAAMLLVPPWTETMDIPGQIHRESFTGYHLLSEPPKASLAEGVSVNYRLLLTQLVFLCAIVAGGLFYFNDSLVKPSSPPIPKL